MSSSLLSLSRKKEKHFKENPGTNTNLPFILVVANGMYTFHSYDIPFEQENVFLNNCWRSKNGRFVLDQWCHVFIARIPALSKEARKEKDSVSFESACLPGYFMRHKNYHFLLQKRDGTELFGKIISFVVDS